VALNGWLQPTFQQNHVGKKLVNFTSDTFNVGLIATGPNSLAARTVTEGYEFVSTLLANNGTALTEVSGGGYSRQSLASVTYTLSGLIITFTANSPSWTSASFTTYYAWIHDETASSGTDATRPLLAIYDLGGAQSPSAQTFTLAVNASGIFTDAPTQ
jgi:hypothetical protein